MADNSVPDGGQFGIFSEHFAATKKQRTIFGGLSAKFGGLSAKFGGLSEKKFYSTDPWTLKGRQNLGAKLSLFALKYQEKQI